MLKDIKLLLPKTIMIEKIFGTGCELNSILASN